MLVIKRFSEKKKVFRERKKTKKIRAKRGEEDEKELVEMGEVGEGPSGEGEGEGKGGGWRHMVWRGTSLRYEMGEKKVNEVDFISQGVELVSKKFATMTKSLSEIQLEHEKVDELVAVVVKVVDELKEIENRLLEEVEVSLFGKRVMILEWMSCVSILV
nr:hypothetical protein [Tanacetum cinerariifolium]